jgi:hypothetical protein
VRADVSTDTRTATPNMVGREPGVGRTRLRRNNRLKSRRRSSQLTDDQRFRTVRANRARVAFAACSRGQPKRPMRPEAIDWAAHAQRPPIEHVRVHHSVAELGYFRSSANGNTTRPKPRARSPRCCRLTPSMARERLDDGCRSDHDSPASAQPSHHWRRCGMAINASNPELVRALPVI